MEKEIVKCPKCFNPRTADEEACTICEWKKGQYEGDTDYMDNPVCPWCGHIFDNSFYKIYETTSMTCCKCDKDFHVEVDMTLDFTTRCK